MVASLPPNERRIFRNIRLINDTREKDKALSILAQFFGCLCIIIAIILAVAAMVGTISVLLNYQLGYYQSENYEFGKMSLFLSVLFLVFGFFLVGITALDKLTSVMFGKAELLTTNLSSLPPVTLSQLNQITRFELYGSIFLPVFLIAMLILVAIPGLNTLSKIAISLVFGIIGFSLIIKFVIQPKGSRKP